jgi:AP-1 complex subunit mu
MKFEKERVISFVPPDGEFDLINYRLETSLKSLFTVDVLPKFFSNKTEFYIKVILKLKIKAHFKNNCIANNVEILIP